MKVVILDDWEKSFLHNPVLNELKQFFDVEIYHDRPNKEQLIERLREANVVIPIRERTKLTKEILKEIPSLKLIAQTGAGLAHIDMEEVNRLKIPVATTPGGSGAVVELVFGFIIAHSRKLVSLHNELKQGIWTEAVGGSLEGKTIGLIGLGKIGSRVAQIAKVFNMRVLAWGPRLTKERALDQGVEYVPLEVLLQESHVVSLHVRLVPETRNLLREEHFKLMRPDALIINTSRGEIMEETALIKALQEKKIGGAALDVFHQEPLAPDHPLTILENVILTPHIGWKTDRMFAQFFTVAAENIISYFIYDKPVRIVNLQEIK